MHIWPENKIEIKKTIQEISEEIKRLKKDDRLLRKVFLLLIPIVIGVLYVAYHWEQLI